MKHKIAGQHSVEDITAEDTQLFSLTFLLQRFLKQICQYRVRYLFQE